MLSFGPDDSTNAYFRVLWNKKNNNKKQKKRQRKYFVTVLELQLLLLEVDNLNYANVELDIKLDHIFGRDLFLQYFSSSTNALVFVYFCVLYCFNV